MENSATEPTGSGGFVADFDRCVGAFDAEFDYVYHALRRQGVKDSDAEDLVQDVFLVMWRRWAQYDATRPIRPWLAGIAFRVAYNYKQRAGREVPGGLLDPEDQNPGPEERIASDDARVLVRRVLAALPEKYRALIISHDVDGISVREIAEALAVPIPTAHTRLRAARKAFAKGVKRLQTVSATRARLAPLLQGDLLADQGGALPADAGKRRRAVQRARALLLLPAAKRATSASSSTAQPRPRAQAAQPGPAPAGGALPLAGVAVSGLALLALITLGGARWSHGREAIGVARAADLASLEPDVARGAAARVNALTTLPTSTARFAPPPPPSPITASLGQGLIGYWRFDDPFGSPSARDLSGNGNDCWLRHLDPDKAWREGRLGGAIHLSGSGWLECPRIEALARLRSEMTIAGWVLRAGTQQNVRALVSRQVGTGSLDAFHFGFRDDDLALRSPVKGGGAFASFPREAGHWHHVVATLDAAGVALVYIDGQQVRHKQKDGRPSLGGGANPLIIGGGANGPDSNEINERFQGMIDELLIYDRALTPIEVRALAAGTQPHLSL